jgi:tetratricopeptide (TPR) repeat protein
MSEHSQLSSVDALNALEAFVQAQTEGPDSVIAALKGKTDVHSVKRLLGILLELERYDEAVTAIAALPLSVDWADKATCAYVSAGDRNKAREVVRFTQQTGDVASWHRSILAFVESCYKVALQSVKNERRVNPEMLSNADTETLRELVAAAEPIKALVLARGKIENELESLTLQYTAHAESLLNNLTEAARIASWLLPRKPLPMIVARLMLARTIRTDSGVPERLRVEHAKDVEAQIAAALIEGELAGKPREAWDRALALLEGTTDQDVKLEVCKVLLQLSQLLGTAQLKKTVEEVAEVLPQEHRFLLHARTLLALEAGDLRTAEQLVDSHQDDTDSQWLQSKAGLLVKKGLTSEAIAYLEKAAGLLPHPDLLQRLASLAFEHGRFDTARSSLERLARITPGGRELYVNLAVVSVRQSDWKNAAIQFQRLLELEPNNIAHAMNAANALARAGEMGQALTLYERICSGDEVPLEATLGWANLLKADGRAIDAFRRLKERKPTDWQKGEYVLAFLDLAYAAGEEEDAHEAFVQLRRLQLAGAVGQEVLQEKSLDDFKELIRTQQRGSEQVAQFVLQGKLPWLFADTWIGRCVPYWHWRMRTQETAWIFEDPNLVSQRSIYSTNGFSVRHVEGGKEVSELQCSAMGSPVVADLSSLMTLHRLGLLEAAVSFFGKILYPAVYHEVWLREGQNLVIHQPSRVQALSEVRRMVEAKQMAVARETDDLASMQQIQEHSLADDDRPCYRIRDLLAVLTEGGLLSDAEVNRVIAVSHRPKLGGTTHPALNSASKVLIDLSTLTTLHQVGVMPAVVQALSVSISQHDFDEVVSGLAANVAQLEVRAWQKELADRIRSEPRFVEALHTMPAEWENSDDRMSGDEFLASPLLALQRNLPLLADDRCLQAYLLNQRTSDAVASFGTDKVIESLVKAGHLDWDRAAELFLQLCQWRYRFFIPPAEVIHALCRQHRQHPPGRRLTVLARYVHSCMRDPGLFSGFEPSTIPTTMANRVYQQWTAASCEAIALIWMNESEFSTEQAKEMTGWIIRELLPSPPKSMGPLAASFSRLSPGIIFSRTLLKLTMSNDYGRAHDCLVNVGRFLGLDEAETQRNCLEVLNAI